MLRHPILDMANKHETTLKTLLHRLKKLFWLLAFLFKRKCLIVFCPLNAQISSNTHLWDLFRDILNI